jgi:hypothetical protein
MPILQIEHRVRDFDAWKQAFDNDPVGREQKGVRRYRVLRSLDDPNYVVVDLEFDSSSGGVQGRAARVVGSRRRQARFGGPPSADRRCGGEQGVLSPT